MGQSLNLLWESGGAVNRSSIVLGYTEPWLDRRHTLLNVQLYDRVVFRFANNLTNSILGSGGLIGTDTRYNEQRTGAQVTLSRPFRRTYSAALTLKGENVRVDRLALTPDNARIIQNGPIISFTAYMQHNTRDLEIDPVTGNFQSISAMFGRANLKPVWDANGNEIGNALGTVNFIKTGIELRQYFSLTGPRKPTKLDEEKTSIALRLSLGTSVGTLPFFEQFFVGGVESLRGYREDRFWGNNYFLGSVEFRQPLARRLKGVVFLDIGNAWGGAYSDVRLQGFSQSGFQLRTGFGVGLRVGTPIGPVRIDLGYGAEGARTHFSIGNVF
jgi:outer membrane protein insertion porin family